MRKYFVLTVLLVFGIMSLAIAAPVSIMGPDGQSRATVRNGILFAGGAPNGTTSIWGSGLIHSGSLRLLSLSFFSSTTADIVGVYNTIGNYDITDLEFEFDIGISANTSIKTNETIDCKGAKFERGLGILAGNSGIQTTAIFDY